MLGKDIPEDLLSVRVIEMLFKVERRELIKVVIEFDPLRAKFADFPHAQEKIHMFEP
jgi:hypothetical protein